MTTTSPNSGVEVHDLTVDEARELFEENARYYLHLTGEEFLRAYDSGEYRDRLEEPGVREVLLMLPLVR